jgi:hypothetical protein
MSVSSPMVTTRRFLEGALALFASLAVLAPAVFLAGCSLREAFRFRMMIEIAAGGKTYAGSSIIELYRNDGLVGFGPQGPRYQTGWLGTAPLVDLGNKGVVVACLDGLRYIGHSAVIALDRRATGLSVEVIVRGIYGPDGDPSNNYDVWNVRTAGSTTRLLPRLVWLQDGRETTQGDRVVPIDVSALGDALNDPGIVVTVRIEPTSSWISYQQAGSDPWLGIARESTGESSYNLQRPCVERER